MGLLGVGVPHVPMHLGQGDVQVLHDPVVLVVASHLELDGQRAVCAGLVLTDEAIGLEPAGQCGLCDRRDVDSCFRPPKTSHILRAQRRPCGHERRRGGLRPMGVQVHAHAHCKLVEPQPLWRRAAFADRLDDVVGRRLDELAIAELHSPNRLPAVGLDRDDAGGSVGVVDLAADLLALDELPDRDEALRGGDERVIGLARRALRVLLEADVEPDRRVEGRHLVEQDVGELGLEGVGVLGRGEVAALAAPAGDGARHAADHLAHRALALVGPSGRGSTSGRRCWWRSATSSSGTRPRAARRPGFSGSPITASRISHSISSKDGSRSA